jgi:chemotaxis protein methyltransferase CheR
MDLGRQSDGRMERLLATLPPQLDLADEAALRLIEKECAIGETSFLRQPAHFAALTELLPSLGLRADGTPLRLWSAGCSSGEEAYSLAAVLMKAGAGRFEILGTDVRSEAIAQARTGRYRPWSLRGTEAGEIAGWLLGHDGAVEVHPRLRELVRFEVHNLIRDPYPTDLDVIFCRNVLMYFHEGAAAEVLAGFTRALRPGGVLILGDVDPGPGLPPWREERIGEARVYRRSADPPQPVTEASDSGAEPEPGTPAERLERELGRARRLCDLGEVEEGMALLAAIGAESPLAVEPQVLTCMLAREAGRATAAREAARRSCFLALEQPVCRFLMAACLLDAGEEEQGALHLDAAAALLMARSPSGDASLPLPYGEGLTAPQLQRMIDAYRTAR